MIQSVLDAIPTYYLSLFRMPRGVANILEKKMRDFLWEGFGEGSQTHLVVWDSITLPKENGGLGIGNLMLRNIAVKGAPEARGEALFKEFTSVSERRAKFQRRTPRCALKRLTLRREARLLFLSAFLKVLAILCLKC